MRWETYLSKVEDLPPERYAELQRRLRRAIHRLEGKLGDVEGRERDFLLYLRASLHLLKELARVRRRYYGAGGKEELPLPVPEREVEEWVKGETVERVVERIKELRRRRDEARERTEREKEKVRKLFWRYLYLLLRRELSLLNFYLLQSLKNEKTLGIFTEGGEENEERKKQAQENYRIPSKETPPRPQGDSYGGREEAKQTRKGNYPRKAPDFHRS